MAVTSLAQGRLIDAAIVRAHNLGHHLGDWERTGRTALATCILCNLYAVVSTVPDEPSYTGSTQTIVCQGVGTPPDWSLERSTALAS